MKTLTLNLKRQYFDEILAGTKTHEYRDIFPENVRKFVYYKIGNQTYPGDAAELPPTESSFESIAFPVEYDCIKFLTGAYSGKRPYMIVEVKAAEIKFTYDENGEFVICYDEARDVEFIVAQIDYTLGKILEVSDN